LSLRSEVRLLLRDPMWEPHQWVDLCNGKQKIYTFLTHADVCAYSALIKAQGWKLISIQTASDGGDCARSFLRY
jgi:hypothetical protein